MIQLTLIDFLLSISAANFTSNGHYAVVIKKSIQKLHTCFIIYHDIVCFYLFNITMHDIREILLEKISLRQTTNISMISIYPIGRQKTGLTFSTLLRKILGRFLTLGES